ncbi:uncharacterized protein METZ01_LOCUS298175 [marine metagenome]|uniref:J domain-containing protein n=1 Tax=marine metagenome TaxID=408172 RepID=A0A382MDK4_9ZZZZ
MIENIRKSLFLFCFDFTARYENIKKVYRKSIADYHPDKVSNLGKDLQISTGK